MPSFRCNGQEWELPNLSPETLLKIRPSVFISHFFAIESNKRKPASSSNKHFLTEAFKMLLANKLGFAQGHDEEQRVLQRWKDDEYWSVGHGEIGDPFSTRINPRVNPNTYAAPNGTATSQHGYTNPQPDKLFECYFWSRDGYCKFSDADCKYAHYRTGLQKDNPELHEIGRKSQPIKYANGSSSKKTECFFWGQGSCKFSDEECKFAHYPIYDDYDDPRDPGNNYHSQDRDTEITSSKQLECYFWRRDGFCKKSEDECLYAHHPTGKVKEGPGALRSLAPIKPADNPNKIPVSKPSTDSASRTESRQNSDRTTKSYVMPGLASNSLSELTLSAFFDTFCYANPTARKEPPWDTVLSFYRTYVKEHFGNDTNKHIIAAYKRTKLPIPPEVSKKHICQIEDELPKKSLSSRVSVSEKSNGTTPVTASKRVRSMDGDLDATALKRVKSEHDTVAIPTGPKTASMGLPQTSHKDPEVLEEHTEKLPPRQSTRLYSPSMPHIEIIDPGSKERINGSTQSIQGTPASELAPRISKVVTSNSTKEPSRVSTPIENRLSGRLAAPIAHMSPTVTSQNDHTTAIQNGSHETPPKDNDLSPKHSRILNNKPSLPGLLPQTHHNPSYEPAKIPLQTLAKEPTAITRGATGYALSISEKLEALKAISSGYHNSLTSTRMTSSPVPVSSDSQFGAPQPPPQERAPQQELWQPDQSSTVDTHNKESPPAQVQNTPSPNKVSGRTYQEQPQEPIGAHIVRLEALLRGALLELETLKRIAK